MRIVLDAMGGDHAPHAPVQAAVQAARQYGCQMRLVGPRATLAAELRRHQTDGLDIDLVDAPDVITMEEHPAQAVRRKPQSSHVVGLRLVRAGQAEAFVSAGHSGASMAGGLVVLGRLPGIERPALGTLLPQLNDKPMLWLDMGATTDCKPEYLLQFAQMGSIYVERLLGVRRPRVGLLSNGEEANKGDKLVQEAHVLLRDSGLHFVGNVEPKDALLGGVCDVVVADGFVGNLVLKMGEAALALIMRRLIREARADWRQSALLGLAPAAALALLPGAGRWRGVAGAALGAGGLLGAGLLPLIRMQRRLDYRSYGGAPLLGVKGVVVIAHGKSDVLALVNAIRRAQETYETGAITTIADSARPLPAPPQSAPVP